MMAAKVVEVYPGIYEIFLPLPMRPTIINVYLVDCHGAWALIDTGTNSKESLTTLEEALAQVGVKIEQLGVVISTHHHVDHFGGSGELKRRAHATVYLHQLEAERVNRMVSLATPNSGREQEVRAFFEKHGCPVERFSASGIKPTWVGAELYAPVTQPDRYLNDGDVITVGERKFEVVWTPGHAPGHCVIYLRKEKVMIVGDHLLPKITPHVGFPPETRGDPLGDFIDSQLKVQRYGVDVVLPAHGAIFHDHRHRANQLIEHHKYREAEMLDLTRRKPQTAFEVAQQVFGDDKLPLFHLVAAMLETLAHLEHARLMGRARKSERDGRILFEAS